MVSKDGCIASHIRAVTLETVRVGVPQTSVISAVRTYAAARADLGPGDVINPTSSPGASCSRGFRHAQVGGQLG